PPLECTAATASRRNRPVTCRGSSVLRDKQDEKTYCLTGECSPDFGRCLTPSVPVAALISARATAPLPNRKSMLTDVGPVELWATRQRRPSAAANPQGSLHRNRWKSRSRHC